MDQPRHQSNHLLASFPSADLEALLPHLGFADLPQGTVLYEDGDVISKVYFPHIGVISLVVDLASGETIETAMVGRESLAGGSAVLGGRHSLNRAIVQIEGAASVLETQHLRALAERSPAVRDSLIRHEQLIVAQAQQSAACNATHTVEARLCRWLLRARDLMGSDDLPLTHEFLAEMMGVRRTSVTLVASTLQQAGLIRYKRGHIRVLNIEGLKESACECYETVRRRSEQLIGPASVAV
jgi:CRP-like cAMP-binding protein